VKVTVVHFFLSGSRWAWVFRGVRPGEAELSDLLAAEGFESFETASADAQESLRLFEHGVVIA
jgi:hypothetical protein